MNAIVIDTREQMPLEFKGYRTVRKALRTGDYSLMGFCSELTVERKSVQDLVSTLFGGFARFERELVRMEGYKWKYILVEGSVMDVALYSSRYAGSISGYRILDKLMLAARSHGVCVLFGGSRQGAGVLLLSLFRSLSR